TPPSLTIVLVPPFASMALAPVLDTVEPASTVIVSLPAPESTPSVSAPPSPLSQTTTSSPASIGAVAGVGLQSARAWPEIHGAGGGQMAAESLWVRMAVPRGACLRECPC